MSIERLKEFLRIHRENNVKDEVLAVDIFTDETIEKLFTDLPKFLAVVEAGDEIFSYLKVYSSEHGGRVGQVPPGFEYKMHHAMKRWAEARAALREETK